MGSSSRRAWRGVNPARPQPVCRRQMADQQRRCQHAHRMIERLALSLDRKWAAPDPADYRVEKTTAGGIRFHPKGTPSRGTGVRVGKLISG